jgi:hypothetical protein
MRNVPRASASSKAADDRAVRRARTPIAHPIASDDPSKIA